MKIHPTLKSILWIVVPLLLGGLGFYGLYRDTDWHELQETLRTGVNYPILLFSLLFGLMSNLCRGLRWELLVRPLTAGEAPPRRINAVCTVLGSYTVNMGIPRSGEVWRCVEMERREDIPFAGLFGTLIVDRLTDVTMLGLILLGIILSSTDFFIGYFASHPELEASLRAFIYSPWSVVLVVVGLLALGGFVWLPPREPYRTVLPAYLGRDDEHQIYATPRSLPPLDAPHLDRVLLLLLLRALCLRGYARPSPLRGKHRLRHE